MTPSDVVTEIHDKYGEWIEMSDDPVSLVTEIMSNKIAKMDEYIRYLEKRLKYDSHTR